MQSFYTVAVLLTVLFVVIDAQNECYHAWSVRSSTTECKVDTDCAPGSSCIFSLTTNSHICCGPKAGAVLPVCPPGKNLPPLASSSGIVCDPNDEDQCPDPFKCLESATQFDKLPGQSNFVCCS